MAFLDKLTKATQDAVRGTKDFTDIARQNSMIADEQKQITSLYQQIGKLYYETNEPDPETPIGMLCLAVKAASDRIAKCNEAIRQIKGAQRCPSCGADNPLVSSFCGICGAKIENVAENAPQPETAKKTCHNCGAQLSSEMTFCSSCGQKQINPEE